MYFILLECRIVYTRIQVQKIECKDNARIALDINLGKTNVLIPVLTSKTGVNHKDWGIKVIMTNRFGCWFTGRRSREYNNEFLTIHLSTLYRFSVSATKPLGVK